MADVEDVRDAIAALVLTATHPGGLSITSSAVVVMPGYPNGPALDAGLAQGKSFVYVNPISGMTTEQAFDLAGERVVSIAPAGVTATIAANAITFAGVGIAGQTVQVSQSRLSYHYSTTGGDAPATIAAAFASKIAGSSAAGATLTTPLPPGFVVSTQGVSARTVRRQRQGFQVNVVAPTAALRRTLATAIDVVLAATPHLTAADGTPIALRGGTTTLDDMGERELVFTRVMRLFAAYDTMQTTNGHTLGAVAVSAAINSVPTTNFGAVIVP